MCSPRPKPSGCTKSNQSREHARTAPPRPTPATWEQDVGAVLRYAQKTSVLFDAEFGPQRTRAGRAICFLCAG